MENFIFCGVMYFLTQCYTQCCFGTARATWVPKYLCTKNDYSQYPFSLNLDNYSKLAFESMFWIFMIHVISCLFNKALYLFLFNPHVLRKI